MRIVMFRLLQVFFAIALLAIAFWPGLGLFYVAKDNAAEYPYIVAVGASIWIMLLALNLPLSRSQFQLAGAGCLIAMMVTGALFLRNKGLFDPGNQDQLIITAIVCGGILLGWFTIASHIWRSYRGVYGVDDSDTGAGEG